MKVEDQEYGGVQHVHRKLYDKAVYPPADYRLYFAERGEVKGVENLAAGWVNSMLFFLFLQKGF